MVMDCVVLDEDSNEMNENNQNLDEEDEEDLNYAANLKIAKRMSMHQSSVAGPSTTIRDKQLIRKQTIAHRIDQICEYAQVLMHCLLYKTNYYDRKIHFDKYIKYDIVVYVNKFILVIVIFVLGFLIVKFKKRNVKVKLSVNISRIVSSQCV